jgi:cysteine desulfuration protein SufE
LGFDQIREDFAFLDEWEDRYRYIIELGRKLEPLPDSARVPGNKVSGCASQVWLSTQTSDDGRLHFVGDSDAHIVRGLIAVLLALFNDKTPDAILDTDAAARFAELGLDEHLSTQRSNGVRAMIRRIRDDAQRRLAEAD